MYLVVFCNYILDNFFAHFLSFFSRVKGEDQTGQKEIFWKHSFFIPLLSHNITLQKQFCFRITVFLFSDTPSPLISKALMDLRAFSVHRHCYVCIKTHLLIDEFDISRTASGPERY